MNEKEFFKMLKVNFITFLSGLCLQEVVEYKSYYLLPLIHTCSSGCFQIIVILSFFY